MYEPGEIITYEGQVWDVDAKAWEIIDRGSYGDQPRARFKVVKQERGIGHAEFVRVVSADYDEPYEYMIFDIDQIERTS